MGKLSTVLTTKAVKGKKGSTVASNAATTAELVINHLLKIGPKKRNQVIEITLDNASQKR